MLKKKWFIVGMMITGLSVASAGDRLVIYVDDTAVGNNDGSGWEDAFTDLQDALALASWGDEIHVAEGIYVPSQDNDRTVSFVLKDDLWLLGGYPDGGGVRDPVLHETILSGDLPGANTYQIVQVNPYVQSGRFDGFVIRDADGAGYTSGGGMILDRATLTVQNCVFLNNRAEVAGALLLSGRTNARFYDCTFSGNQSENQGGAVQVSGDDCYPFFYGCKFEGNRCSDDNNGGAVFVYGWTPDRDYRVWPTFRDCVFRGNSADIYGGAIHCWNAPMSIDNCLFTGNSSRHPNQSRGGAITIDCRSEEHSQSIFFCTFTDNGAFNGNSIWFTAQARPVIRNSIFRDRYDCVHSVLGYGSVQYSDVQDLAHSMWKDELGNFDADPIWIAGPLGDFYLHWSSPCVNAGQDIARNLDLGHLTTDAYNEIPDGDTLADIGYHYWRTVDADDCNRSGIPDACDLDCDGMQAERCLNRPDCGQSIDGNDNGIPDACEGCAGDEKLSAKCKGRPGKFTIKAKFTKGTPGIVVTFRLDDDPDTDIAKIVNDKGKAKTTFKDVEPGAHAVRVVECVDLIDAVECS